jgi:hypothetical protein
MQEMLISRTTCAVRVAVAVLCTAVPCTSTRAHNVEHVAATSVTSVSTGWCESVLSHGITCTL